MRRKLLESFAEHIERHLYEPRTGYFSRASEPVLAEPTVPLDARNTARFDARQRDAYARAEFSTPSELFAPHYARAVAHWALREWIGGGGGRAVADRGADGELLRIVEAGGGRGTLARGVLDALRDAAPEAYERLEFVSVELAEPLAAAQEAAAAASPHAARWRVERQSALAWTAPRSAPPRRTLLLATELLDNLAHDKLLLARRHSPRDALRAFVRTDAASGRRTELYEPLAEPLVERAAQLWLAADAERGAAAGVAALDEAAAAFDEAAPTAGSIAYVPTRALQLVDRVAALGASCLLADFDSFPPSPVPGRNAPLVQRNRVRHALARAAAGDDGRADLTTSAGAKRAAGSDETLDVFADVLDIELGSCDIMFATNFRFLELAFEAHGRDPARTAQILKQGDFLQRYVPDRDAVRRGFFSRYNAMLDDFPNVSFFASVI